MVIFQSAKCSEVRAIPNLSLRVDDKELRKHFEAYGAVQAVDRKATSCSSFLNDSFLHGQACLHGFLKCETDAYQRQIHGFYGFTTF